MADDGSPIPMEVVGVRVELPSNQPIVLLREEGGTRYLPIWIGANEATAIATAMEGVQPPRPLTHDLMRSVIDAIGALAVKVVITEMRDSIFFADLTLEASGNEIKISSRPSDAIALAVKVVITEMRDSIFFADLTLEASGNEIKISSRPSDAIALAVRTGTPVFAAPSVLDEAAVHFEETDEEEEVARFREFLEEATIEDFLGGGHEH